MNKILKSFAFAVLAAGIAACSGGEKKAEQLPQEELPETAYYTAADTAEILNQSKRFMDLVVAKNFDEALSMLGDKNNINQQTYQPEAISDAQRERLLDNLKQLNITDYTVKSFKFVNRHENEVVFEVIVNDSFPTKFYLRPYSAMGKWSLTLADSMEGDEPLQ